MRENFEIEKEFKFSSNIAEITSISLEERHDIKDNKLEGVFVVSGEYKIHEISLNKEKFSYKIPYTYDIRSDIEPTSLELEITNFVYDSDNDSLFVNISYEINGDRKDILLFDDKEDLEEFLKSREVELILDDVSEEIDEVLEKDAKEENETLEEKEDTIVEETLEENDDVRKSINEEVEEKEVKEFIKLVEDAPTVEEVAERSIEESKKQLLNSINVDDDNYITYKVHIVKSEDTMESILMKYNVTQDELKEYNDVSTLKLGDKLIIPVFHEE